MFPNVDWTGTFFQGCSHGCPWCWTLFMPWGAISHEPCLKQIDEYEIIKGKTGIVFLNSAHDSFAACIPDEWILAMIRWIGRQPAGLVFYLQSQNLWRALSFIPQLEKIKDRVIMGTTIQTDNEELIKAFCINAPTIYSRYQAMLRFGAEGFRIWLSLEPLFTFNYYNLKEMVLNMRPEAVMVGLDNYAHRHKLDIPQPDRRFFSRLRENMMCDGITVVEKKGMREWRDSDWSRPPPLLEAPEGGR